MKHIVIALLLVACKSKEADNKSPKTVDKNPPETPAADPACAAKAAELEPMLATLFAEAEAIEINMGWKPVMIDRPAAPVDQFTVDWGTITPTMKAVFDASEANHVENNLGVGADRLARTLEMKVEKNANHTKLRLDIDADAKWGDVTALVEAATKAGYTELVFAFETESKLVPPPGVESKTMTTEAYDKARERESQMNKECDALGMVGLDSLDNNKLVMAKKRAKNTAAAVAKCNCKPSPDEVRATLWAAHRWHQAHLRVPLEFKLAADGKAIERPKDEPWGEAHKALLDASGAIKLVAK